MKSRKEPYAQQPPNATAVSVLRTWLRAVGIPAGPTTAPGFDLALTSADGSPLDVRVSLQGEVGAPPGGLTVRARDLTALGRAAALEAFWLVLGAAGYERRVPFERGEAPAKKLSGQDEDFLVAIRHAQFRQSVDPQPSVWTKYRDVMEKCCWAFLKGNWALCQRAGLEHADLMTYARCLVVNYHTHYEIPNPLGDDNERKCYAYLRQRLRSDLRPTLFRKERSTLTEAQTVAIALHGRPDLAGEGGAAPIADEEDPDYPLFLQDLDEEFLLRQGKARRGQPDLGQLLGALPHDQLVATLRGAADNEHHDLAARREAFRRLREHQARCAAGGCKRALPPPTQAGRRWPAQRVPQAQRVPALRAVVQHFKAHGFATPVELSEALGLSGHECMYYRHAALTLGLVAEAGVTDAGRGLLLADPGSPEEGAALREAIEYAEGTRLLTWYLDRPEPATKIQPAEFKELSSYLVAHFQLSESTARRRASVVHQWRAYLAAPAAAVESWGRHLAAAAVDPGVEVDEEAPGADALCA